MTVEPDPGRLRDALRRETARLADALRTGTSLERQVPGLDWTAGQLAAHLSVVYRAFAATVRGEESSARLAAELGLVPAAPGDASTDASTNASTDAITDATLPQTVAA